MTEEMIHSANLEIGVWRSRGYLPHLDDITKLQSITLRLADSLPRKLLDQLEHELQILPEERQAPERRRRIEEWLDAGSGCCALKHPAVARVAQNALLHSDGDRYRLLAWCIMPNHLHVLIKPETKLAKIVQSWKSYTGRWIMQRKTQLGLRIPGKRLWMREYWDRFIRDQKHLDAVIDYIHMNPVKGMLCKAPADWPWSSAKCAPPWERRAPARHENGKRMTMRRDRWNNTLGFGIAVCKSEKHFARGYHPPWERRAPARHENGKKMTMRRDRWNNTLGFGIAVCKSEKHFARGYHPPGNAELQLGTKTERKRTAPARSSLDNG